MKVVIQRVKEARVVVDEQVTGAISIGLLVFVGFAEGDTTEQVEMLATKIPQLRIFGDEEHRMNRSLLDVQGGLLSVSQFTLYGDCSKGRRPSFVTAARPEEAKRLYEEFNRRLRDQGIDVKTGIFGADMKVSLVNDGPVTFVLEN